MRRIIVVGNREEISEFCPEAEIQAQETAEYYYQKAKRLARWKKTRDITAWLESMPWY